MGAAAPLAEPGAAQRSVCVSEEFRALYRAYRAGRAVGPAPAAAGDAPQAGPAAASPEPSSTGPALQFQSVRLRRSGLRPLQFEGALAKRVCSDAASVGGPWCELAAYVAAAPGAVVLQLVVHPGASAPGAGLAAAEWVSSPEAGLALIEGFDPAASLPAPAAEGGALELLTGGGAHLRQVESVRRDFVAVVRAFCGSAHPVAARLESRFGFCQERSPA